MATEPQMTASYAKKHNFETLVDADISEERLKTVENFQTLNYRAVPSGAYSDLETHPV